MSARILLSISRRFGVSMMCSPSRLRAYLRMNAAFMGRMSRKTSEIASMCLPCSRTPARDAATYASSGNTSHAPHTMSSSFASGTKSFTIGLRFSVRLPRRMVPIWVIDPMGDPWPRFVSSTPAMRVEATAPRPTVRTPSFPSAGAMVRGSDMVFRLGDLSHLTSVTGSKSLPYIKGEPLCGVGGDECVHDGCELFTFVFLKEMAASNNGGVGLTGCARNLILKVPVAATGDGVAIAERSEEWFFPRPQNIPRNLVCNIRWVIFAIGVERRENSCSSFV